MNTAGALSVPGKMSEKNGQMSRSSEHTGETISVRTEIKNGFAPPKGLSDVELLEAFRKGNERAFAELYTRYKAEIYTFCLRMLAGDSAEAGDAFQETFIKVYEKAATFTYGANVRGWLYMIARNVALNVYRSKRPEETIELHRGLESTERHLSPDFYGEQRSLREALEHAISKLPIEFREPFVLREFDGLGYPEIADITGATLSLVKIRIHRAKQRLRKMLAPLLAEEMNISQNITTSDIEDEENES
jgi:RNA polymerase sigma-70 factor (ECF subfamily)